MIIKKMIGIVFVILMAANLMLFVFGFVSAMVFWAITILCAIVAYGVLPRINNEKGN